MYECVEECFLCRGIFGEQWVKMISINRNGKRYKVFICKKDCSHEVDKLYDDGESIK